MTDPALLAALRGDDDLAMVDALHALRGAHTPLDEETLAAVLHLWRTADRPEPTRELQDDPAVSPDWSAIEALSETAVAPPPSLAGVAAQVLASLAVSGTPATARMLADAVPSEAATWDAPLNRWPIVLTTEWRDEARALEMLVPSLLDANETWLPSDESALALSEGGIETLVRCVARHPAGGSVLWSLAGRAKSARAVCALLREAPSPSGPMELRALLRLLVQAHCHAPAAAIEGVRALQRADAPATDALLAVWGDAAAGDRLEQHLRARAVPVWLPELAYDALRTQSTVETSFPMRAWLDALDPDPWTLERIGLLDHSDVRAHLRGQVMAGMLGDAPRVALHALSLLIGRGAHASDPALAAEALRALRAGPPTSVDPTPLRDAVNALATADPPLDGLLDALLELALAHPSHLWATAPSLVRLATEADRERLSAFVAAYLDRVERFPLTLRFTKDGQHWGRDGSWPELLWPLVEHLGDDALAERLRAVLTDPDEPPGTRGG